MDLNGDWGLGIGDWANPQSPIPKSKKFKLKNIYLNLKLQKILI